MKTNDMLSIDTAVLDFSPAYKRVADFLQKCIREQRWEHGAKLPPEPILAQELKVSVVTLRHALQILEQQDLLCRRRGRNGGNFVRVPGRDICTEKKTFGLITSILDPYGEPYFQMLLNGISRKLGNMAKLQLIISARTDLAKIYHENNLDGIISIGCVKAETDEFKKLALSSIPHVVISESFDDFSDCGVVCVDADNFAGAVVATRYLLSLGHRTIAHIGGCPERSNPLARLKGYEKALADAGIAMDATLVYMQNNMDDGGSYAYEAAANLLERRRPPTAIFAAGHFLALEAIRAIKDHGLRIPEDISIIGFDDFESGRHISPALTTIRQPLVELGEKAAETIMEWSCSGRLKERKIILPTELIVRKSCANACT